MADGVKVPEVTRTLTSLLLSSTSPGRSGKSQRLARGGRVKPASAASEASAGLMRPSKPVSCQAGAKTIDLVRGRRPTTNPKRCRCSMNAFRK
jgi:hypothetical protein